MGNFAITLLLIFLSNTFAAGIQIYRTWKLAKNQAFSCVLATT